MGTPRMTPRNIEAIFRLTPLQEGLLYHTLDTARPGAYFDQFGAQLEGDINIDALREAWNGAVEEHAILRTFFTWEKRDHPLQVVRNQVELPFDIDDARSLSAATQQTTIAAYTKRDREAGFVLDQAPLMRLKFWRLADNRYYMLLSFSHLILDGWSMRLVLANVQARYTARVQGQNFIATDAPTFEQFVNWQRQQNTTRATAFWRDYLAGFSMPSSPRLKQDGTAIDLPAQQTAYELSSEKVERLQSFARRSRVTLNTLFVAAWALVLERYTDRQDVVFGTTSAGRPPELAGIDRTAGLFISTVPTRVRLSGRVDALLDTIQREQVAQREHDHVGLSAIQKASDVPAGLPLFETLLVFENFPSFDAGDQRLTFDEQLFEEYSHYPLALLIVPGPTMSLIAVHDQSVFSAQAITDMLAAVDAALAELIGAEQVRDIDVLRDAGTDLSQALGASTDVPAHTVLEEIRQHVAHTPERTAIAVGEETVSYAKMWRLAEEVAVDITQNHPGACACVIVCERNHWAIVAQLAALMAGKVYVTLDAKDPLSRIEFVMADLSAGREALSGDAGPLLLTTSTRDAANDDVERLYVDRSTSPAPAAISTSLPRDTAYVIYTSGSTGQPKGVRVSHGNLVNSTLARGHYYSAAPEAFALLSSLATDSSIAGIYWTLCTGGKLVLPADRAELDVTSLIRVFTTEAVTHTLCVPSLYALMLDELEQTACRSLRAVIVAGEACPQPLVKRHAALLPGVALHNEYGPSESCVWVTAAQLRAENAVSIGKPIVNTVALVVDRHDRLVPRGVPGELVVGGANVALGYLNRVNDTDSRFVHRESPLAGRYYRTGDRVAMRLDGDIVFLGRTDHQLKVRGFRVEPGEVEAALCELVDIDAAVVVIEESDVGGALAELVESVNDTHADFVAHALAEIEQLEDDEVASALHQLMQKDFE
ncbi:MAG: amino acid adenylation domain-containing protein [Pseudomonadota bacterium]